MPIPSFPLANCLKARAEEALSQKPANRRVKYIEHEDVDFADLPPLLMLVNGDTIL